jgi:hypothetical protein
MVDSLGHDSVQACDRKTDICDDQNHREVVFNEMEGEYRLHLQLLKAINKPESREATVGI